MSDEAKQKLDRLREILREMGSALVAYSGGTDSTFLLKVAAEVLGDRVLAVTGVSETYTSEEHVRACKLAESFGARHLVITTEELKDPDFARNPPNRCYHCKSELFGKLRAIADRERLAVVVDASNVDDCSDLRPGRKAAMEKGVRSPLIEAGLTKQDIRALSKDLGLPTWDLPSSACLASRVPYGEAITGEKLTRVEKAERLLRDEGFRQVRVRVHGPLARIEVEPARVQDLADGELRERVVAGLKALGFTYVTVDLQGYRTGSHNEMLRRGAFRMPTGNP